MQKYDSLAVWLVPLPITVYFKKRPKDLERLATLLYYPAHYMYELTLGDVVSRIRTMQERNNPHFPEAASLLGKLFRV
ncbi:MAG: hypothetical protein K2O45_09570 [Oscillospiraceae bacterium]|nr:hypothetical protein [Oscillospiraceae bacterium]